MKKRGMFVAGNWKMNKNYAEAVKLAQELSYRSQQWNIESCICPPYLVLKGVAHVFAFDRAKIKLGAQNVFWAEDGAYTGEISASMLKDVGCAYAIIGHSERREIFHEDSTQIAKKVLALLKQGISPIVCCGESLELYERGQGSAHVTKQIREFCSVLSAELETENILLAKDQLVFAYEPIWAIGSGRVASPEYANQLASDIRRQLASCFSEELAQSTRILYGGSVKPANSSLFFEQEHIDGALVGGAALDAEDFSTIVESAQKLG